MALVLLVYIFFISFDLVGFWLVGWFLFVRCCGFFCLFVVLFCFPTVVRPIYYKQYWKTDRKLEKSYKPAKFRCKKSFAGRFLVWNYSILSSLLSDEQGRSYLQILTSLFYLHILKWTTAWLPKNVPKNKEPTKLFTFKWCSQLLYNRTH